MRNTASDGTRQDFRDRTDQADDAERDPHREGGR